MKTFSHKFIVRLAAAICLLSSLPIQSWAQGVFKCTATGKTVYQSSPCVGEGKKLEIASGPSEQQVQEARMSLDAAKVKAETYPAPSAQRSEDRMMVRKVDCAKLNKDRADAFGRRNARIRESRESNIDQSLSVDRYHDDIRRIESQMVKGDCKPT